MAAVANHSLSRWGVRGIDSIVARAVSPAILLCEASKTHAAGELFRTRNTRLSRQSLAGDAFAAAPQFPAFFRRTTDLAGGHMDAVGGAGVAGVPVNGIVAAAGHGRICVAVP